MNLTKNYDKAYDWVIRFGPQLVSEIIDQDKACLKTPDRDITAGTG
ncbi:hypothetical protein [Mucilaginibacter endophyticus]|nr:hypothetical protein [Mucilaginibacter endophyticus]